MGKRKKFQIIKEAKNRNIYVLNAKIFESPIQEEESTEDDESNTEETREPTEETEETKENGIIGDNQEQ